MGTDRITKLNAQMQKELGGLVETLVRPEVPGVLVTVTGVEIASTLRSANVYVSVYGGGKNAPQRVLDLLHRKRALLQSDMARKIILKYTPVLTFRLDGTAERADRVMSILRDLHLPEEPA